MNLLFFHTHLLKSSYVSVFDHISRQNVWLTSQIWYHVFSSINRSGFSDFFRIFLKSSISAFLAIFLEQFVIEIWYDDNSFQVSICFPNFSRFYGFFQIFRHFIQIFRFHQFWSNFFRDLMISISNFSSFLILFLIFFKFLSFEFWFQLLCLILKNWIILLFIVVLEPKGSGLRFSWSAKMLA